MTTKKENHITSRERTFKKDRFVTPEKTNNVLITEKDKKCLVESLKLPSKLTPNRRSSRQKSLKTRFNMISFEPDKKRKIDSLLNNDYCDSCQGTGKFLCCDSCPRSFHLMCLNPPMDPGKIPEEEWHCHSCRPRKLPKYYKKTGVFGNLLEVLNKSNPISFELPDYIKDCVKGVETNENGDFVDAEQLTNPKSKDCPLKSGWSRQLPLTDKKNKTILCFYCHRSGLSGPIISCDYCSLYWHLDCLNPPLAVPPPPHLKWRCPAHSEHLLPKARKYENSFLSRTLEKKVTLFNGTEIPPLVEQEIFENFFRKVSEKRKLARYPLIFDRLKKNIEEKLNNSQGLVLNQYNLQLSFPKMFNLSKSILEAPTCKELLSDVDIIEERKKKIEELINISIDDGIPEKDLLAPDNSTFEISKTFLNRFNAICQLMKKKSKSELMDFFISSSKS